MIKGISFYFFFYFIDFFLIFLDLSKLFLSRNPLPKLIKISISIKIIINYKFEKNYILNLS